MPQRCRRRRCLDRGLSATSRHVAGKLGGERSCGSARPAASSTPSRRGVRHLCRRAAVGSGSGAAVDHARRAGGGRAPDPGPELEPDLFGLTVEPAVGIGQQAHLVVTPAGNLLWDPPGYVDDEGMRTVRELGDVVAIAASHPHMFGVQVEWSRALGGVPVLVSEPIWGGSRGRTRRSGPGPAGVEVVPGVTLVQPGGHFPGSSVVHWAAGAGGRGCCSAATPSRRTRTARRRRSCAAIPTGSRCRRPWWSASPAVSVFAFDRLYDNFGAHHRQRRPRGAPPVGRPLHRLGPRRLRPPDLTSAGARCRLLDLRPHDQR